MRAAALLAAVLWQAAVANEPPVARPDAMRYERAIRVAGNGGAGQVCATLDAAIFPHAAASLTDLRIFPVGASAGPTGTVHEVPYAITMSEAANEETETARVLNLGSRGDRIVFDLEMPQRAYTEVSLDLDPAAHDFLATAVVSGSDEPNGKATTLGTFTLFDLASQRLSRDTTIPLAESTFKFLHVEMNVSAAPGGLGAATGRSTGGATKFDSTMVLGATVPPSREAQTVYTTVAETASLVTRGRESVATFDLPARVPVERVSFVVAAKFAGNFSREVRVSALTVAAKSGLNHADGDSGDDSVDSNDGRAALPEVVTGNILRVRASEAGREIRSEQLGIPAILGANLQRAAKIEVAVENGDDQPLPIASVRLEMRQRKICFDAPVGSSGADLALFYGDSELAAPLYDYARLFVASRTALPAQLGPEALNAGYRAAAAELRPFAERHPEVLWIALIAAISTLGLVAMHSAKNVGRG